MGEPAIQNLRTTFKAILDEGDKASLFDRLAKAGNELLVKPENSSGIQATNFKAKKWNGTHLYLEYVSGPLLTTSPTIVAFEIGKIWFCFTATIFVSDGDAKNGCALDFDQGFEVQRREAHRVTIPENTLKANYFATTLKKTFKIIDLSEGGMALFLPQTEIEGVSQNLVIDGTILIEGYDPLEGLFAEVMHLEAGEGGKKAGCRFVKITLATRQRISFLVNACHREVFGKFKK